MTITSIGGLAARDSLLWIVHHWTYLTAALAGGGTSAGDKVSGSTEPRLPLDVDVSALIQDVTRHARDLGQILAEEAGWVPITSTMPGLLRDVAQNYHHFTEDDPKTAQDFCDDAHDLNDRVRRVINPIAPPTYIGPCNIHGCVGRLRLRDGETTATCPVCTTPHTLTEHQLWLHQMLDERLMPLDEIRPALKMLGKEISLRAQQRWVAGDEPKLRPVDPEMGLYRLADAVELADSGRRFQRLAQPKGVA